MRSNPATFFVNFVFVFYESRRLKSIKNTKYGVARKFGSIIGFIDDLNCNKWWKRIWKSLQWNIPSLSNFENKNTHYTETTFLDLHLFINEGQMKTSLYDKRNSCNFNVLRFLYKRIAISSKCSLQSLVQNYFESVEKLTLWCNLLKHLSGVTDGVRWVLSHRPRENACPFQRNIKLIFFGCASFLAKYFIRG